MERRLNPTGRRWRIQGLRLCCFPVYGRHGTVSKIQCLHNSLGLNVPRSHVATWPPAIKTLATRENVVSPREFQQWALQNNGILSWITEERTPRITLARSESNLGTIIDFLATNSAVSYPF